jgi:hypothetical protein
MSWLWLLLGVGLLLLPIGFRHAWVHRSERAVHRSGAAQRAASQPEVVSGWGAAAWVVALALIIAGVWIVIAVSS